MKKNLDTRHDLAVIFSQDNLIEILFYLNLNFEEEISEVQVFVPHQNVIVFYDYVL